MLKKKLFRTLVKEGKAGFIQEELLPWGFVVEERDWAQLGIQ